MKVKDEREETLKKGIVYSLIAQKLNEQDQKVYRKEVLNLLENPSSLDYVIKIKQAVDDAISSKDTSSLKSFFSSPPLALLSFDVDRIKSYVFATSKPLEVAGGSEIIKDFNEKDLGELLEGKIKPFTDPQLIQDNIVFSKGGSGILIIPSFCAPEIKEMIEKLLPLLSVTCTVTCFYKKLHLEDLFSKGTEPFGAITDHLIYQIRTAKEEKDLYPIYETPGFLKRCDSCNIIPASEKDGDDRICEVCNRKRSIGRQRQFHKELIEARDFRKLVGEGNYLGLIYLDANRMGSVLGKMGNLLSLAVFSELIDKIFKECIENLVQKLGIENRGFQSPVLGGDDVILILPAKEAPIAAKELLDCLEDRISFDSELKGVLPQGEEIGVSVGLVIAHSNYPIRYVLNYAEILLKSAKAKYYKNTTIRSAIDFMVIKDSSPLNVSIKRLRDQKLWREIAGERLYLTNRPYSLADYKKFIDDLLSLKRNVPPSQIRLVSQFIPKGKELSNSNFIYQILRNEEDWGRWLGSAIGPYWRNNLLSFLWECRKDDKGIFYSTKLLDWLELYDFIGET